MFVLPIGDLVCLITYVAMAPLNCGTTVMIFHTHLIYIIMCFHRERLELVIYQLITRERDSQCLELAVYQLTTRDRDFILHVTTFSSISIYNNDGV